MTPSNMKGKDRSVGAEEIPDSVANPEPKHTEYSEDITRLLSAHNESGNQITYLVRYIGFGLIGFYLAALNSSSGGLYKFSSENESLLILIALSGSLAIFLEYVNHVLRRIVQSNQLRQIDRNDPKLKRSNDGKHYLYDPSDPYYVWSHRVFKLKQLAAGVGCVLLVFIFVRHALT